MHIRYQQGNMLLHTYNEYKGRALLGFNLGVMGVDEKIVVVDSWRCHK